MVQACSSVAAARCEGAGLGVVAWVASRGCPGRFARTSGHADGGAARAEWLRVVPSSGPIQMMNSAIAAYWHAAAAQTQAWKTSW